MYLRAAGERRSGGGGSRARDRGGAGPWWGWGEAGRCQVPGSQALTCDDLHAIVVVLDEAPHRQPEGLVRPHLRAAAAARAVSGPSRARVIQRSAPPPAARGLGPLTLQFIE